MSTRQFEPDVLRDALRSERSGQLDVLRSALDRARQGTGAILVVEGEEGIGKTSLVREFLRGVETGDQVLVGVCDDMLAPRPLGPFRDMLRSRGRDTHGGPEAREVVIDSMLDVMSNRLRPAIVIVEDVHWADDGTLDILRFLGRRMSELPAVLVVTYHAGALRGNPHLTRTLGVLDSAMAERIEIPLLSDESVARVAREAGVDPDEVVGLVAGNPFYLSEVLSSPTDSVSASVMDAVLAHFGALPDLTRATLEVVSVSPGGVGLDDLDELTGGTVEHLEPAETARIVQIDKGIVRFRHELVRLSVRESLTESRRIALHRRLASRLVETGADSATIVYHAQEGHLPELVLEYGPRACDQAAFVEDHQGVITLAQTTLALGGDLDDEVEARLNAHASYAYYALNRFSEALESAIAAVRGWRMIEPAGRRLANSLLLLSRMYTMNGNPGDARSAATEALEILESHGKSRDHALAFAMLGNLDAIEAECESALSLCNQALEKAREVGAEDVETHALIYRGLARIGLGDLGGFDDNTAAIEGAQRLDHGDFLSRAASNRAAALIWLGRHPESLLYLNIADEAASDHGLEHMVFHVAVQRGHVEMFSGDWTSAETRLRECVTTGADPAAVMVLPWALLGRILLRRGDSEGADLIERAWERAISSRQVYRLAVAGAARIEKGWLEEDTDLMVETADKVLPLARKANLSYLRGEVIRYLQRIGIDVEPEEGCSPPYAAAIAGDTDLAIELWSTAGNPYQLALECLESSDEAVVFSGLRSLDDLGATAIAARYRRLLRDRGMVGVPRGPRRATKEIAAPLTPRQLEMLEMVSRGLTSPEIADELFLSRRTVDNHIAAVIDRLGAASRGDAVRIANERGWIEP